MSNRFIIWKTAPKPKEKLVAFMRIHEGDAQLSVSHRNILRASFQSHCMIFAGFSPFIFFPISFFNISSSVKRGSLAKQFVFSNQFFVLWPHVLTLREFQLCETSRDGGTRLPFQGL